MTAAFSSEQSIASDQSGNVVVGLDSMANIAFVSQDAGATFTSSTFTYPPHTDSACIQPRYVAVADDKTFFMTWAPWPVFNSSTAVSATAKARKELGATRALEISADGKMRRIKKAIPHVVGSGSSSGSSSAAPNCGYSAAITKSTDGGKTWTSVYVDNTDFYFNEISCWSPTLCVAVAEGFNDAHAAGRIFRTADGTTWTQVFEHLSNRSNMYSFGTVQFASATDVWVGGGADQGSAQEALLFHSTDGGKTWAKFAHGIPNISEVTGLSFVLSSNGAIGFAAAQTTYQTSTILRFDETPTGGNHQLQ
jgi:photosystem II stability/assembly factor-like uncharacterized protein